MLKQDLKNLRYLKKEIARLDLRIEELSSAVTSITKRIDASPRGNRGLNLVREELIDTKIMLEKKKKELAFLQKSAEKFIQTIPESLTRLIISKRYIDGYSWRRIAFEVGGGNTEDGVKKIAYRFMDK